MGACNASVNLMPNTLPCQPACVCVWLYVFGGGCLIIQSRRDALFLLSHSLLALSVGEGVSTIETCCLFVWISLHMWSWTCLSHWEASVMRCCDFGWRKLTVWVWMCVESKNRWLLHLSSFSTAAVHLLVCRVLSFPHMLFLPRSRVTNYDLFESVSPYLKHIWCHLVTVTPFIWLFASVCWSEQCSTFVFLWLFWVCEGHERLWPCVALNRAAAPGFIL